MRLVMERGALLRALGHVTSVVERRSTIPILSNVYLGAGEDTAEFKATDLEREVVESTPAEVSEPGATTVSAHMLHDIVRKLPEGAEISLSLAPQDGRLTLASGHSRFSLAVLPADGFPEIAVGEMTHSFELDAKDLKRVIEKTRFAISTEETRYYLNGIYLHAVPGEGDAPSVLRAVATDGHRLAQFELPLPEGAAGMPGIIIPRKTVHEVHRLIEDADAPVRISLSATNVRFAFGTVTLTSKLIDGTFPDYARVIPQSNDKVMNVSNAEFASAVDRVSTLSSERGRAVKLHIDNGTLVLSVNNPDSGSAQEELAVSYDDEPLEIGFNARYLLDISGQIDSDTANFLLADPGSPTIVRDGNDGDALYVLMPMRV